MNNKTIGIIVAVIIIVGIGGLVISQQKKSADVAEPVVVETEPTAAPSGYTMPEVAMHKDASSCWSAINGNVYDLTNWIGTHPGGQKAILGICGKDGSAAFTGKHGGMPKQEETLATFKIGAFVQ